MQTYAAIALAVATLVGCGGGGGSKPQQQDFTCTALNSNTVQCREDGGGTPSEPSLPTEGRPSIPEGSPGNEDVARPTEGADSVTPMSPPSPMTPPPTSSGGSTSGGSNYSYVEYPIPTGSGRPITDDLNDTYPTRPGCIGACGIGPDGYARSFVIETVTAPADQSRTCGGFPFYVWGYGISKVQLVDVGAGDKVIDDFDLSENAAGQDYAAYGLDLVEYLGGAGAATVKAVAYDLDGTPKDITEPLTISSFPAYPCILSAGSRQ